MNSNLYYTKLICKTLEWNSGFLKNHLIRKKFIRRAQMSLIKNVVLKFYPDLNGSRRRYKCFGGNLYCRDLSSHTHTNTLTQIHTYTHLRTHTTTPTRMYIHLPNHTCTYTSVCECARVRLWTYDDGRMT